MPTVDHAEIRGLATTLLNQTAIDLYIPERHGFCRGGSTWPPTRGQPHKVAPTQGGEKCANFVMSGLVSIGADGAQGNSCGFPLLGDIRDGDRLFMYTQSPEQCAQVRHG
jgi:hypothetical protein